MLRIWGGRVAAFAGVSLGRASVGSGLGVTLAGWCPAIIYYFAAIGGRQRRRAAANGVAPVCCVVAVVLSAGFAICEPVMAQAGAQAGAQTTAEPPDGWSLDGWSDVQPIPKTTARASILATVLNNLLPGIIPTRTQRLAKTRPLIPTRESWTGAALSKYGWSIYTGLSWAPFGDKGIRGEGWRVRLSGGYSRYHYDSSRWNFATQSVEHRTHSGAGSWSDLQAGYQKQLGALTLKGFIGVTRGEDGIAPFDKNNSIQGRFFGAKGSIETWYNISKVNWLSADISYAQPHNSYSFNARAGYRVTPTLSAGPELAQFGNDEGRGRRIGVFARYEWDAGELSVSAGITGALSIAGETSSASDIAAYGTLGWLRRF